MSFDASLKRNLAANYVSQIYVAVIGVVMVPLLIKFMGAEAYGLVGVFSMMQAWFQLLDLGITPTISREATRLAAGHGNARDLRHVLRAAEKLFILIAVCATGALVLWSDEIAAEWLKAETLNVSEVRTAIVLIALIVGLRLIAGLYRGILSGLEELVWVAGFNVTIASCRFILVLPILIYVDATPTYYFGFQLLVAIVELLTLTFKSYTVLPKPTIHLGAPGKGVLRKAVGFSAVLAFTHLIWVAVTQLDKLVLSKYLPLTDYGYFSLAVLVASGLSVISGPIAIALQPRLTRLYAAKDHEKFVSLYRSATQIICVLVVPATLMLAFFSKNILLIWSGDYHVSVAAAPILTTYALGNGLNALSGVSYSLQLARGDLKLHVIRSILFVFLVAPTIIYFSRQFGAIGAGYTWVGVNVILFLLWVPLVHTRFFVRFHLRWMMYEIIPILSFSLICTSLIYIFSSEPYSLTEIILTGIAVQLAAIASSSYLRNYIALRLGMVFKGNKVKVDLP